MVKRVRFLSIVFALLVVVPRLLIAQDPTAAFFDGSALHEIRLTVNAKDWESLKEHFQDNTYYPADFKWNNQVVRNIGIRSRGKGSRRPNKPGLRLDFNRYTSGQTFMTLKSFILRNNSQDTTNMRERLSMLFFQRLGLVARCAKRTRGSTSTTTTSGSTRSSNRRTRISCSGTLPRTPGTSTSSPSTPPP